MTRTLPSNGARCIEVSARDCTGSRARSSLSGDQRGVVSTEYLLLVAVFLVAVASVTDLPNMFAAAFLRDAGEALWGFEGADD